LGWGQWIALYCALSFAMLGVDAAMSHHDVVREVIWSWTPLFYAPPAVIYSVIAIFSAAWRRGAWTMGLLGVAVGIAGTLLHDIPDITERGARSVWQALLTPERPILAPAAFAATAVLLLLLAWAERWRRG